MIARRRRGSTLLVIANLLALAGCTSFAAIGPAGSPHPPAGLSLDCATALVVGLRWDGVTPGTTLYVVSRDGHDLGETVDTSFADVTVEPSTSYTYTVSVAARHRDRAVSTALQVATPAASPSGDAPSCQSSELTSMKFDWSSGYTEPNGSDLWSTTWAADGGVYAFFGDGGGIGGDNHRGRTSFGVSRFAKAPPTLENASNIYGGFQAAHPAGLYGKASSIIAVGDDFYAIGGLYTPSEVAAHPKHLSGAPDRIELAYSRGNAYSWEPVPWAFCQAPDADPAPGVFCPTGFVQYGPGGAGAPGDYVYLFGVTNDRSVWDEVPGPIPARTYLARVRRSRMLKQQAYEYFAGLDANGKPRWSADPARRRPVFSDRNPDRPGCAGMCSMSGSLGEVVYDSGLRRYLGIAQGQFIGQTSFYESPRLWGPWRVVSYNNIDPRDGSGGWGNLGRAAGNSIGVHIVNAWTSEDGRDLWLTYSSDGTAPPGALFPPAGTSMDSLNVIQAHLQLR